MPSSDENVPPPESERVHAYPDEIPSSSHARASAKRPHWKGPCRSAKPTSGNRIAWANFAREILKRTPDNASSPADDTTKQVDTLSQQVTEPTPQEAPAPAYSCPPSPPWWRDGSFSAISAEPRADSPSPARALGPTEEAEPIVEPKPLSPPSTPRNKTISPIGERRAQAILSIRTSTRLRAKHVHTMRSAQPRTGGSGPAEPQSAEEQWDPSPPNGRHPCLIKGCQKTSKISNDRARHMDTHFVVYNTATEAGKVVIEEDWGYPCPRPGCQSRFSRKDPLIRHMDHREYRECQKYKGQIVEGERQAWKTKSGCQYLNIPARDDPMYTVVIDLRKKYGLPPEDK